jgi:tyrosyl-tRNA synthetase
VNRHQENPAARVLQKQLAIEVTSFVHGGDALQTAIQTTDKLFADLNAPAESLSIEDLEGMEGVQLFQYDLVKINEGVDVVSFLAETGVFPSKGEARKMVQNGGVSINRKKVEDVGMKITNKLLLHEQYIMVQKGKKNHYLIQGILPAN